MILTLPRNLTCNNSHLCAAVSIDCITGELQKLIPYNFKVFMMIFNLPVIITVNFIIMMIILITYVKGFLQFYFRTRYGKLFLSAIDTFVCGYISSK